jgi:hypothetical protein
MFEFYSLLLEKVASERQVSTAASYVEAIETLFAEHFEFNESFSDFLISCGVSIGVFADALLLLRE